MSKNTFCDLCALCGQFGKNGYPISLGNMENNRYQPRHVALKRSVSIAVVGGKSLSGLFEGWPKPEFRQARHQREAQRPESFQRRAFSFGSFLFGGTKRKEHD
jgi:hypothetical protein